MNVVGIVLGIILKEEGYDWRSLEAIKADKDEELQIKNDHGKVEPLMSALPNTEKGLANHAG